MPHWVIRLHEAADEVFWAARLNLLWIAGTLAGGVVLGIGPATLAAFAVARARSRNGHARFIAEYRREFRRGTTVVLPILVVAAALIVNYHYFDAVAAFAGATATVAALAVLVVVASFALPMAVHYHVPAYALLPKASLFALTRPAPSALLLLVAVAVAYLSRVLPFLVPAISVGGWIQLDTWLCLRFFAENEARLRRGT